MRYFTLAVYIGKGGQIRNRCCDIIDNNILCLGDGIAVAIIVGPGNNVVFPALMGSVASLVMMIEPAATQLSVAVGGVSAVPHTRRLHQEGWLHQEQEL